MVNLKQIAATLAVLGTSAFMVSGCNKDKPATENPTDAAEKAGEGSCGAEKGGEGSCGAEKGGEGSCGAEKGGEGSCGAEKGGEEKPAEGGG
jgi:uncharacterized low-complexity protein